ncbi:MAG: M20/M25/M40 family metallo-hydrolase [Anaerolineae bacterium]|nr:M20/M25/M40 family metallo-hydrolase [Anaerolineae bacterium]
MSGSGRLKQSTALLVIWALLLLWAAALGLWWMRLPQIAPAPPSLVQIRATATAHAVQATPTALPIATPVTRPLLREPGPAVRAGNLWAVALGFDEEQAFEHIVALADPAYAGRRAGTEGGRAAAESIAERFAAYDLQPAGDDGYFQAFPLDYFIALEDVPTLSLVGPDGAARRDYRFRQDFTTLIGNYGGEGQAEGPVVWANTCSHDDFDNLDAVGKVVLCRQGSGEDLLRNGIEHGVAGLLLWRDAEYPFDFLGRYREPWVPVTFPAFAVSPQVVEDLLQGSGLTLADLTLQFQPLELPACARLSVDLDQREGMVGRNVLGVLPGADAQHADEVVIVGAHYDHLGRDPGGAVWPGANDDASGVAALLEIARSWQEAGYVPERTVLFAAWDAEEQGLWGSTYYIEHPRYPLTATVAMLQLDMVGEGAETLNIDGPGPQAEMLEALATTLGITATVTEQGGGSDHVPFRQAGVPASLLIWEFSDDTRYHRPSDLPQTIQPERLAAIGRLASLALLNLASVEPDILDLLAGREAALAAADRARFLATSAAGQQAADAFWWDDAQAHGLRDIRLRAGDVIAAGDVATATLTVTFRQGNEGAAHTLRGTACFRRTDEGWRYAGPALAELAGERFVVAYPPGKRELAASVLEVAEGPSPLPPIPPPPLPTLGEGEGGAGGRGRGREGLRLELYPTSDALRVAVSPALPPDVEAWVDGNGARLVATSDLTRTQLLTATLTQLALAQMGMAEAQAPWLWAGLPLVRQAAADPLAFQRTHLPALQGLLGEGKATPLAAFPLRREVPATALDGWQAQAWAMTAYLLDRYGPDAAARLAAALGRGLALDAAFEQALSTSPADFDASWPESWRSRLAAAGQGLQTLLTARQTAVAAGDADAFLATVDPQDATLLAEEGHWFADLSEHPLQTFEIEGQLLALTDEGALARFTLRYQLADGDEQRVSYDVALRRRGERWFYAGVPFQATSSEHFLVRHPPQLAPLAAALLPHLEEVYARQTADPSGRASGRSLAIVPEAPIEVKLYDDAGAFRASIALSLPDWVSGWTEPGEAIRIRVDRGAEATTYRQRLAYEFAHYLLALRGLRVAWLGEGIAQVKAERVAPRTDPLSAARRLSRVQKAARQGQLLPLAEMPPFQELGQDQVELAYGQAWDAVRTLIAAHGQAALNELVRLLGQGEELDAAFRAALGMTFADFEAAWRESAARGHVQPRWTEEASAFDGQRALQHVRELAGPAYDGREAGTPGGEAAARYVAEQFAALGLQPAGDDGYFQRFPITRTALLQPPRLTLRTDDGRPLSEFVYGHDYREAMTGAAGGGTVRGRVVWVRDGDYTGMDLGGKIALCRGGGDITPEVQRAIEHNAGGLLLVTDVQEAELQRRLPLALRQVFTTTIPVLELTRGAFERLVKEAGYTLAEVNASPPALPLPLQAEMNVPLSPPQATTTANVLGLIPGGDPERADELVILSAHYDHVGRSADGTLYPGADDDASGVAVLLEVARLWREAGVRPRRSVLFAAWGAEEFGQLGSAHYLSHPLRPLTDTVGLLHLDGVGAGSGFFLTMQGDLTREALLRLHLENAAEQVGGRLDFVRAEEVSDQTAFQERDVPACLLTWKGSADDANHPADTPDRVDPLKLSKTGRIVALALRALAE